MKNKTLKNLIALGALVIFVLGANSASAYYSDSVYSYNTNYGYSNNYTNNYGQREQLLQQEYDYQQREIALKSQLEQQKYAYEQQKLYMKQNLSGQNTQVSSQPSYTYVQAQPRQQVQYVTQPATPIRYVSQQAVQPVQYVNTTSSTQGASVVGANTVVATNRNTGTKGNTGQYVNYDANSQNLMLASAYGAYNGQQIVEPQVVYDNNGVTALSVNGSGSFMPSSVFQWFLLILLILGIIIIARMVSKSFSKDPHGATVH